MSNPSRRGFILGGTAAELTLDLPDNVVVRRNTGSLLLCEDGGRAGRTSAARDL